VALQSGWKILNVNISNGGSGYGSSQTYTLSVRTKSKHGQSFAGTCSSNGSGVITSVNITNNGENYSSGSTTLGILDAPGNGAMLIPIIGQDVSMSISDMNVEKGVASNAANSDIHDLYQDFSSVAGENTGGQTVHDETDNKPNFDYDQGGPVSGSAQHPIHFDEFYGAVYDIYGGGGCLLIGTSITLQDETGNIFYKNIEDVNVGDTIVAYHKDNIPLDFDSTDTWSDWSDDDISDMMIVTGSVRNLYFDYYDNYYRINSVINTTEEHPWLVKSAISRGEEGSGFIYQYKRTDELVQYDDYLVRSDLSEVQIVTIQKVEEEVEVVNLNCEPYDVYFAQGYMTHNVHEK
jgi:hypothetical protein